MPARPNYGQMVAGTFAEPPSGTIYSSNIQLSGIPDKLIVFVRKPIAGLTCVDADSYATITGISINFNNQAGLLSSMTPQQLYRNSVQSGLVGLTWEQFSGSCVTVGGAYDPVAGNPSAFRTAYSGSGASLSATGVSSPGFQVIPTTGTILVLNFAEVIQLTEEYYAPGSLGSFNLQLSVTAQNNTKSRVELMVGMTNCASSTRSSTIGTYGSGVKG